MGIFAIVGDLFSILIHPAWTRSRSVYSANNLKDERLAWLLAIGAPFVEELIEPGYQDLLTIYPPEQSANNRLVKRVRRYHPNSRFLPTFQKHISKIDEEMVDFEDAVMMWYQIPESRRAKAVQVSEKTDEYEAEFWRFLYESKIDHSNSDTRLHNLVSATIDVRMACFLGVISEEECIELLERIGQKIERRLAGVNSWEDFGKKLDVASKLITRDDSSSSIQLSNADLLEGADSIWKEVSFDQGWSLPPAREGRIFSNVPLPAYRSETSKFCDGVLEVAKSGDFDTAFQMIEEAAATTNDDMLLGNSIKMFSPENFGAEEIEGLPDKLKHRPLAILARANWFKDWAWVARGTGTSDTVGAQGYRRFGERLKLAWADLERARVALPDEPIVLRNCFDILPHLGDEDIGADVDEVTGNILTELQERFPGFQPAFVYFFHFQASKWGGDFDEAFNFTRQLADQAPKGSVVPLLIYQVVLQEWEYYEFCEDDKDALKAFLKNTSMNEVLDQWFEPLMEAVTTENEFRVLSTLSCWYHLRKDKARLEKISDAMQQPALYDGSFWEDVYNREYVVAELGRLYYT